MQLSPFDDLPYHQAIHPVDIPASTDPHFNDGYYFAFYRPGTHVFCGLRRHPNSNVLDGYAGAVRAGEQRDVRMSRAMRPDTGVLAVGPLSLEVLEPMRRQRLRLDDAAGSGLSFDVELTASAPPFLESPHVQWRHGRVLNELLRYAQVCRASGWLEVDGAREPVQSWHAARDHSWGIRATMGPRTPVGGLPETAGDEDRRALRIWVPFEVEGHCGFFHTHEAAGGERLDLEGRIDREDGSSQAVVDVEHHLSFAGDGRLVEARFALTDSLGLRSDYLAEVACEPAHPQGFGYDRGWSDGAGPGLWRGPALAERDRFDARGGPGAAAHGPAHVPPERRLGGTEFACTLTGPGGATGMAHLELMRFGRR